MGKTKEANQSEKRSAWLGNRIVIVNDRPDASRLAVCYPGLFRKTEDFQ